MVNDTARTCDLCNERLDYRTNPLRGWIICRTCEARPITDLVRLSETTRTMTFHGRGDEWGGACDLQDMRNAAALIIAQHKKDDATAELIVRNCDQRPMLAWMAAMIETWLTFAGLDPATFGRAVIEQTVSQEADGHP